MQKNSLTVPSSIALTGAGFAGCESLVLAALLLGIVENTISEDVLVLGAYRAADLCKQMGVDDAVFQATLSRFATVAQKFRAANPLTRI